MHQIKELISFLDFTFATVWGFTIIEVLPAVEAGILFPNLNDGIKTAFAFVGLLYAIIKLIILFRKAKQDERYRDQEIEAMKNKNFYSKFNRDFLKRKDEDS
jgi:undecaprenyl pyrophosphate phosphatase UppP